MVVKLSVEEELRLEASVRDLRSCVQDEQVSRLCGSLLRQVYFQQLLIKQATHHIAKLEMEQELASRPSGRPNRFARLWRRVVR
ncbi:MAG: hypothetical protein VKM92_08795 [Cyanobacteriota bacterium]|nr:hypothetical protein [Cyanobacteriota bacterium]